MPLHPTYDINTSGETVDGTPSGETFRPLRYTETERDTIRVCVWLGLQTIKGNYRMDAEYGLDVELLLNPSTEDEERTALVAEFVLGFEGVTGLLEGPVVTVDDGELTITLTAMTVDGSFSLVA